MSLQELHFGVINIKKGCGGENLFPQYLLNTLPDTILYSRATQVEGFALKKSSGTVIKGCQNCYRGTQEGDV